MPYVKPQDTDLLKLPSDPDYWVRMRKHIGWSTRIDSQDSMLRLTVSSSGEDEEERPNRAARRQSKKNGNGAAAPATQQVVGRSEWAAYIKTLIIGCITEWNLTDENDVLLPIAEESLAYLEDEDGEFLSDEAQKRSEMRAKKKQGPFGPPSPQPLSTTKK